jgi:hypothetical protein
MSIARIEVYVQRGVAVLIYIAVILTAAWMWH